MKSFSFFSPEIVRSIRLFATPLPSHIQCPVPLPFYVSAGGEGRSRCHNSSNTQQQHQQHQLQVATAVVAHVPIKLAVLLLTSWWLCRLYIFTCVGCFFSVAAAPAQKVPAIFLSLLML